MTAKYTPTPAGLERDARALVGILANALRNLDRLGYPAADGEESSAGICYDDAKTG